MSLLPEKLSLMVYLIIHSLAKVTPSCLLFMVQGNILSATLAHWIIALKTAGLAGLIVIVVAVWKQPEEIKSSKYLLALIAALATMLADYTIHSSHFGSETTEAIATGLGVGSLWLLVGFTPLGRLGKGK